MKSLIAFLHSFDLVDTAMRRIYCTFGGSQYDETIQRIVEDAHKFGVDEVRVYDDRWLMEQEFYRLNRWIFD